MSMRRVMSAVIAGMFVLASQEMAQIADHFDLSVSSVEKHIAKAMSALGRKLMRQ